MRAGTHLTVPDTEVSGQHGAKALQPGLPGRWSVWSGSADCPGAHFVVPADDTARATGIKHAVVRITEPKGQSHPEVTLRSTEPQNLKPAVRQIEGTHR